MDASSGRMMILQTLGSIRLTRGDGTEVDEVLRQPKRLALLAYLASPRPGVWHRRDVLLAAFWPDLDAGHARTALRNALYVLRQHLDDGTIRTRGDEEVSIDPSYLMTDAALLEADVAAARFADGFRRYDGDALPGLHVADAEGFETWLHEERLRTRALARNAALGLAALCEQAGDFPGAAEALAGVVRLDPVDEAAVRRLLTLLARAGDRARALDVYERFRARLAEEFEAEPATETVRLVDAIRTRRTPDDGSRGRSAAAIAPEVPNSLTETTVHPPADAPPAAPRPMTRQRTRRIAAFAMAVIAFAVIVRVGLTMQRHAARRTLVVLPMQNKTGRADLDYVATGIDDEIAKRLRGIGGLETTRSAVWDRPDTTSTDLARLGNEFGAKVAFSGKLTQESDSFVVTGTVVDIATGKRSEIGRNAFLVDQVRDVSSRVSAAIAGVMFSKPLPEMPRGRSDGIDAESFRLTMKGWHMMLGRGDGFEFGPGDPKPIELFLTAIDRDPRNARAFAGLSTVWALRAFDMIMPFEEAAARAEKAATTALALDSLEGTAWLNLASMHALKTRSVGAAEPLYNKALEVDPGNPEILIAKSGIYRNAWALEEARDALRMARQLDPLNPGLITREATVVTCTKPAEGLELYRAALKLDPRDRRARDGAANALARLGRWDDAIAELQIAFPPTTARDSALRDTLASGERGYWQLRRADGRKRLELDLTRVRKGEWVAPMTIANDRLDAGEIEAGLDDMARAAAKGDFMTYRAACRYTEARSSPRFRQILESLPKWDLPRPVPHP